MLSSSLKSESQNPKPETDPWTLPLAVFYLKVRPKASLGGSDPLQRGTERS